MVSRFEQRHIGPTHGSIAALVPLRTPSGPQQTEASLETDLVEQLAFSAHVNDIITQPMIRYTIANRERRYTSDVLVELLPDEHGLWSYFLIEVKPKKMVDGWREESAEKIEVATLWCTQHDAEFRILTEKQIRTPFLDNVISLKMHIGRLPDPGIFADVVVALAAGSSTVAGIIGRLRAEGSSEPDVRLAIEQGVANRMLGADLSAPFDDMAILLQYPHQGHDPIIAMLMSADSE